MHEEMEMPDQSEQLLKASALELCLTPPFPRSENHLGYLLQVHLNGRVTWGEIIAEGPWASYGHNSPDPGWTMDILDMIQDDNLAAVGICWTKNGIVTLYRMVPDFVTREFYRLQEWGPAKMVNEKQMHGFEVIIVAVHRLLKGRVVRAEK